MSSQSDQQELQSLRTLYEALTHYLVATMGVNPPPQLDKWNAVLTAYEAVAQARGPQPSPPTLDGWITP